MRNITAATLPALLAGACALAVPLAARAQGGAQHDDQLPRSSAIAYPRQDDRAYPSRDGEQDDRDQRQLGVRVWLENERDLFRPGELTRALVRPNQDAYVAVLHITPDGDVDFLWPRDYNDDGFMRGGDTYSVASRGARDFRVGGGYGIGYVLAVASDEPLDLRRVRDYYYRRSVSWDPALNVYGDPFHAMERFAAELVPGYDEGYGAVDWYSYSVGSSRYRFPRYACYDSYGPWYTSRSPYYDGCDQVRLLLVESPYYYDTRYFRGDRSRYWRRWYGRDYADFYGRRSDPQHGYKEGGYGYDRATGVYRGRTATAPAARPGSGGTGRSGGGEAEGVTTPPSRQRPVLQRRPAEADPVRVSPSPAPRRLDPDEPRPRDTSPRSEPRGEPRARTEPRSEPRSEPRAEPSRSEPRSAPPPRDAGASGRSTPAESRRARPPQE